MAVCITLDVNNITTNKYTHKLTAGRKVLFSPLFYDCVTPCPSIKRTGTYVLPPTHTCTVQDYRFIQGCPFRLALMIALFGSATSVQERAKLETYKDMVSSMYKRLEHIKYPIVLWQKAEKKLSGRDHDTIGTMTDMSSLPSCSK